MRIGLSTAAQDRHFAKAARRVRQCFEEMLSDFEKIEFDNHIHEALLVGITDSEPNGYVEVVPNRDGFFQVLGGVGGAVSDLDLKNSMLNVISRALLLCPFSRPDADRVSRFLAEWQKRMS